MFVRFCVSIFCLTIVISEKFTQNLISDYL